MDKEKQHRVDEYKPRSEYIFRNDYIALLRIQYNTGISLLQASSSLLPFKIHGVSDREIYDFLYLVWLALPQFQPARIITYNAIISL